ncbi:exodeoxyribonuclease VII small subunit [Paracholeplasma manati]|jgi:exodeoxyribonuclease VII small subunit|uniref:Exodeoxyribonuclease 7 small subunit n=1 Tax=Paracholeplasma manati TaxID=591373 RepID=A0ABT2Y5C0_9MOLU|nr:exodeoxyribonuclease VII small subunit [Paracholeplasma manati]MCV2231941.1 exodeoxyribonuclease VII small subunit [Paracholeplasma manati]MDG0888906.1 exodeoxyribonuclease VII small subunit [Paracholeplasma manati]MDX9807545.1 exodeoxyribonuclease VII small subunit [Acholeplasma sp.]
MEMTFEQAIQALEKTVKALENKDIALDEAVRLYNEGLKLSKICYELLTASEKLVVKTITPNGSEDFKLE